MSHRIASLLDKPEKEIKKLIMQLEDKNGYPSHDARHIAQNIQAVRRKIKELGLDPDDTTAEELYHALLAKFEADSLRFDIANGFHSADFPAKASKAAHVLSEGSILPQRWVLKTAAAKQILKQLPPKHLMKQLSYRSADSMLKRENVKSLYVTAHITESSVWKKDAARLVAKLDSTAFEVREICLEVIDSRPGQIAAPLLYNDEVGQLAIVRNETTESMTLLGICVLAGDFLSALGGDIQLAKADDIFSWWREADHLLSDLDGQCVSFHLKDASLNHALSREFHDRLSAAGRGAFLKHLLGRYENQLAVEEDQFMDGLTQVLRAKIPIRQPAFEYAEDF